jgi:4-carboxymuconolactone decarboxylase
MTKDRLPPIDPAHLTPEQQAAAQAIIDGPRGAVYGPFVPLLRSPELMDHAQRLGEYLRYRSALGPRLSELAILITARHWDQQVEWAIHAPIAARAGISEAMIDDIAHARRPPSMSDDEAAVYDFSRELNRNKGVSDPAYAKALALFGERGVVDLMAINGYYTLLAMVMNAAQTAAPGSPLPRRTA